MLCLDYGRTADKLTGGCVCVVIVIFGFVAYTPPGIAAGFVGKRVAEFLYAESWAPLVHAIRMAAFFVLTCGRMYTVDEGRFPYEVLSSLCIGMIGLFRDLQ
jgi:hypothetical protein